MPIFQYGIDVSRYQGNVNWQQVAASGKQFAIVRLGSSNSGGLYIDPYFRQNVDGAHAAGLRVGVYYYTYANTIARVNRELDTFLPALSGLKLEYPVFVDIEEASLTGLGRATLTNLVKYAMDSIYARGYFPGWYTYTSYVQNYLNPSVLEVYPFWIADYRGYVGYQGAWSMWQYSSTGRVSGIAGNVDLNYSYADYLPQIIAANKNGYTSSSGPIMVEVADRYIEAISANAEYFFTANIYNVVGYLPLGLYRVLSISVEPYQGFDWVTFSYNNTVYWAALAGDRVRLVILEDANDGTVEELQNQIAALQAQIVALQTENENLREQLQNPGEETDVEALRQEIAALEAQMESLQSQVYILQNKIRQALEALQ